MFCWQYDYSHNIYTTIQLIVSGYYWLFYDLMFHLPKLNWKQNTVWPIQMNSYKHSQKVFLIYILM